MIDNKCIYDDSQQADFQVEKENLDVYLMSFKQVLFYQNWNTVTAYSTISPNVLNGSLLLFFVLVVLLIYASLPNVIRKNQSGGQPVHFKTNKN